MEGGILNIRGCLWADSNILWIDKLTGIWKFQAVINDLLGDMIETGDVAVFIDNVMVETEIEEEHDDIIEEILRRIAESDLFVK